MPQELQAHRRLHVEVGFWNTLIHQAGEFVGGAFLDVNVVFKVGEDIEFFYRVGHIAVGNIVAIDHYFLEFTPVKGVHLGPVGPRFGYVDIEGSPAVGCSVGFKGSHVHFQIRAYLLVVEVPEFNGVLNHGCYDSGVNVALEPEVVPALRRPAADIHLDDIREVRMFLEVGLYCAVPGFLDRDAPGVHKRSLRMTVLFVPRLVGLRQGIQGRTSCGSGYIVRLCAYEVGLESVKIGDLHAVLSHLAEKLLRVRLS